MPLDIAASQPSLAELDARLIKYGYEPIACNGKVPVGTEWQKRPNTIEAVTAEREAHPAARNIGIRTGRVAAVDVDLRDNAHVGAITQLAYEAVGIAPLERTGSKGIMLVYRNEAPIKKITITEGYTDANGNPNRRPLVEILGAGQQFVAYGKHPDGIHEYLWPDTVYDETRQPLGTPLDELPRATPDKLREFAARAASVLTELGYTDVQVLDSGDRPNRDKFHKLRTNRVPMEQDELIEVLRYNSPNEDRLTWIGQLAGIRACNLRGVDEAGLDDMLLEIAQAWCRGDYTGPAWAGGIPDKYLGDDVVEHDFNSLDPEKKGGATFGTLYKHACRNGYDKPPPQPTDIERFGDPARFKEFLPGPDEDEPSRSTQQPTPDEQAKARQERALKDRAAVKRGKWPLKHILDRNTALTKPLPNMLVEEIVPDGKLIGIWGDTGCGKTYWGVELATAIPMRRPAFGRFEIVKPGDPGISIIFAGEDPDYLNHSRLTAIEQHYGRSLQGLVYVVDRAIPIDDPKLYEEYRDEMRRLEDLSGKAIDFVLNDTLKRSLGNLKQNDDDVGRRLVRVMEEITDEFGCALAINAHQPKSGAEGGIAGTGDFNAAFPVTPHLTGETNQYKQLERIYCEFEPKFRVGPKPAPFKVKCQPVLLPKPVGGHASDVVLLAMSAAEAAATSPERLARLEENDERRQIIDAVHALGATSLDTGVDRGILARKLTGPKRPDESDNDYLKRQHAWATKLDNGSHERKGGKKRKPTPAKFRGLFDDDMRLGKPARKWFYPLLSSSGEGR